MTPLEKLPGFFAPEPSATKVWSETERRFFWLCLITSGAIYLIYAIICAAFINAESYFQTIEFSSYKLGLTASSDLVWEYGARLRSWLQPGIYVEIARAAALLGLDRPLTLLLLFRLFTGFLSWASMWMLIIAGRNWIASEADRKIVYLTAALLWLLPYLGVRTAGETTSAAMLCVGIALLEWRTNRPTFQGRFAFAILAGAAFGLCFEFRYSTGVMAAGAALAYMRAPDERFALFLGLLLGGLAALALGTAINLWGYGAIAFPFLSYVNENFVLGKANNYGTAPFFAYLYMPLEHPMAPVALFLLAVTLIAWFRRPRNILVWSALPYVLLLSVTAHKETRFLFPIAPFLPFFIAFALAKPLSLAISRPSGLRNIARVHGTRFLIIWNLCGLAAIPVVEFWLGHSSIFRVAENAVYSEPRPQAIVLIRSQRPEFAYSDPAHPRFIDPRPLDWMMNPDIAALKSLRNKDRPFLALIDIPNTSTEPSDWIANQCEFLHSSLARWVLRLIDSIGVEKKPNRRELYRC